MGPCQELGAALAAGVCSAGSWSLGVPRLLGFTDRAASGGGRHLSFPRGGVRFHIIHLGETRAKPRPTLSRGGRSGFWGEGDCFQSQWLELASGRLR